MHAFAAFIIIKLVGRIYLSSIRNMLIFWEIGIFLIAETVFLTIGVFCWKNNLHSDQNVIACI